MKKPSDNQPTPRDVLNVYLEQKQMRKTPERYEVLKVVESMGKIFTVEDISVKMEKDSSFQVSRATLFNTMDLFCDAGILIRHALQHAAHYERRQGRMQRAYLVCQHCNSIKAITQTPVVAVHRQSGFTVRDTIIYMNGLCRKCETALKKQKKQ